jgi:hypothetical protein
MGKEGIKRCNHDMAVEFPARHTPFVVVGVLLAVLLVASLLFGAIGGSAGGVVAAAVFALALVPTVRRAADDGPALTADREGIDARAAGVRLSWSDVIALRHQSMPTPGTGARGFLVVELAADATPERSSPIAPRPKDGEDGNRELWIPMTGIEAAPSEVLDGVRQARADARAS